MRVCVDKPLAAHAHTHMGKWRDHRSQAANTQATTNNHHTNTFQTSLMVVTHAHRLVTLTHTRGKQDKEHSTTKGVVAMACTVTMPWHKRATPVVMPSWLVHQVYAPPMQVATSTHPLSRTHKRERKEEL